MVPFNQFFRHELEMKKKKGEYRHFLEIEKDNCRQPEIRFRTIDNLKGKAINWCSNDYLNLGQYEPAKEACIETIHCSGLGSGGTRNLSGTTSFHLNLEKEIADWHDKESALLFNSAYVANLATIETIGRKMPDLIMISDERNHASIIEGIRSTHCRKVVFRHNDANHLRTILESLPKDQPKMVLFETVYSISGNIAPLQAIVQLCRKYKALSYADEVHAAGLYGRKGAGMLEQEGLHHKVDIINGTLAKAVGCVGGYIAASAIITDFIRSFGKPFIFSTSLPPAICHAATISIKKIRHDYLHRQSFFENVQELRHQLLQKGINYYPNHSHITTIPIGNPNLVKEVARTLLLEHGIYIQPVNAPTVRAGEECLRIIVTPAHTTHHIKHLTAALNDVLQPHLSKNLPENKRGFVAGLKKESTV